MTEQFQESADPNGYDARGNKTDAFVPVSTEDFAPAVSVPAVTPSEALAPAPAQVHPVSAESDGYRAPRGLTREEIRSRIRKVRPYSSVQVVIEEWDIEVEVRSMSLGDRNDMALLMVNADGQNDMKQFYPLVIATCTYDGEGEKVWGEEDIAWLNSLDAHILDKIAKPAMELNGFGEEASKVVEDAAGKSSETATSESVSS